MAKTIPNLTFIQSKPYGLSNQSSISSLISAIVTSASDMTYWEIIASASDYILFRPKAGSAIPNCRILIGGDGAGPAFVLAPHNTTANVLYAGLAPDSGKDVLTNPWNGALNPFDTDRFTGLAKVSSIMSSVTCEMFWFIESEETLTFYFFNSATDAVRGFSIGAIVAPPDDSDGEADGRIWGIFSSGTNVISNTFTTSLVEYLGHLNNNIGAMAAIFDPTTPSTVVKVTLCIVMNSLQEQHFQTQRGGAGLYPIPIRLYASPFNYIGEYRQMAFWQKATTRGKIVNSDGSPKGYIFSAKYSTQNTAIVYYNKP